jgi:MYXO-CTERM domain-containing protein
MRLFVASNTFVNDATMGTFIHVAAGGVLTAHNNIFAGPGTPSSTGMLSADNMSGVDPLFVDPANYDYHLQAGSPAIGKGVDPGSAGNFSLTPTEEYVQPLMSVPRLDDGTLDLGAFQYATKQTDTGGSGGAGSTSSGTGGGSASSASTGAGGAGTGGHSSGSGETSGSSGSGGGTTGAKSGCGCRAGGEEPASGSIAAIALAAALVARRRRWVS